jgi:hypothetical protein
MFKLMKGVLCRLCLCVAVHLTCWMPLHAAELDDDVEFGGFSPSMTLEEADKRAGVKGERECKTWEPNPTVHWCRWSYSDPTQFVMLGHGPDGVVYDLERRVPLPDSMTDEDALAQAREKLKRYGEPSTSVIGGNLHWGCVKDDCGGDRMIRVWVMEGHAKFFDGRRHLAMSWSNRIRSKLNQQRFEAESSAWTKAERRQKSHRLKL